MELKFCKVEEVRKYFVYFVKLQYLQFWFQIYRSSHSRNFFGTSALKNIAMLEFIFNKVAGFQARNFIKKRLQHRCFSVKFAKSLRASYLQNTSSGCFWKCLMNSLFIAYENDESCRYVYVLALQCLFHFIVCVSFLSISFFFSYLFCGFYSLIRSWGKFVNA